jgi:hypothetical protein
MQTKNTYKRNSKQAKAPLGAGASKSLKVAVRLPRGLGAQEARKRLRERFDTTFEKQLLVVLSFIL